MDVPDQTQIIYGYDDADRRTSVTLPDGIVEQYGYDNASELTGITYKLGAATLGDLNYGYDSAGKRNAVWGTYARTGLPTAVTSATTYNAANQLTKWANKATSNDLNGSLTNDSLGTTYTWNNRGQIASTAKTGTTVGYAYDAFGRRKSKTVNGTTTSFLYDGANVVQEQSASNANLFTGLGTDEPFSRTIGSDQKTLLRDALGLDHLARRYRRRRHNLIHLRAVRQDHLERRDEHEHFPIHRPFSAKGHKLRCAYRSSSTRSTMASLCDSLRQKIVLEARLCQSMTSSTVNDSAVRPS